MLILLILVFTLLLHIQPYYSFSSNHAPISSFSPSPKYSSMLLHPIHESLSIESRRQQNLDLKMSLYSKSMIQHTNNTIIDIGKAIIQKIDEIKIDLKLRPWTYLSIPVSAAVIGYVTNYVGVKMLFYPLEWKGINIYRWPNQPFGLLGWQGIVPARRTVMATRIVDVTISKLLSVAEAFNQLEPSILATLLLPTVKKNTIINLLPKSIVTFILKHTAKDIIRNADSIVDIKELVVNGLIKNPQTLGTFFQRVASNELKFLVDSGFSFGFALGILQMIQMMFYPANWTLPVSGAFVGYVTNWIALKWIFEPLNPVKFGPFTIHGMFLRRQKEVSADFSSYIADNILTSQNVWKSILEGSKSDKFNSILQGRVKIASLASSLAGILKQDVGNNPSHLVHAYTTTALNLKETLINRMNRLSPAEFEQVLHPVFQQDELTLIIAGGVLGALSGLLQWGANLYFDKKREKKLLLQQQQQQQQQPLNIPVNKDNGDAIPLLPNL